MPVLSITAEQILISTHSSTTKKECPGSTPDLSAPKTHQSQTAGCKSMTSIFLQVFSVDRRGADKVTFTQHSVYLWKCSYFI